mgnify:CR=1 FL=1|jgi:hypothetical protein
MIYFNNQFIDKITSDIPEKISKFDLSFGVNYDNRLINIGAVRFDNDELNSIYLFECNFKINNQLVRNMIKFDVIGNDYKFNSIYGHFKDNNFNIKNEYRYDSDMNCMYEYEKKNYESTKITASEYEYTYNKLDVHGNSIDKYFYSKHRKAFTEYQQIMIEKNIIYEDVIDNYKFKYAIKNTTDKIIYLFIYEDYSKCTLI